MLKRALGATLVYVVLTFPALARVDLFCGLLTGSVCPGMVTMAAKHDGHVHSHVSASSVANQIAMTRPKRVVLGGHSAGCSAAVTAAWHLHRKGIPVDVLLCFDGAMAFMETKSVPPNVKITMSWRQDGWLGGARLCKGPVRKSVCTQRIGSLFIMEETVPLDHLTIGGGNAWINHQAHRLIVGR